MRHIDAAKLWNQLRTASDNSYVLREAVGELATVLTYEEPILDERHHRSIVLCKFIFDVQRTRPRSQAPDQSWNIGPRILEDAISCLAAVKSALPKHQARDESQRLLRQAFVAGLRALSLQFRHPNRRIPNSVHEWRRKWGASSEFDEVVIQPLLEDMVNLNANDVSTYKHELPENNDEWDLAIYFLNNWVNIKKTLQDCVARMTLDSATFSAALQIWLDARLIVFHASYYCLQAGSSAVNRNLLREVKNNVEEFDSILHNGSQSETQGSFAAYLEELEPTPYCRECATDCSCFPCTNDDETASSSQAYLQSHIESSNKYLANRSLAVFNGSPQIDDFGKRLEERIDSWLVDGARPYRMLGLDADNQRIAQLAAPFVLNCPGMHCISGETLSNWMRGKQRPLNMTELYQDTRVFDVNIDCSACVSERGRTISASRALRIMPLSQILEDLAVMRKDWRQWQDDVEPSSADGPAQARDVESGHGGPPATQTRVVEPKSPETGKLRKKLNGIRRSIQRSGTDLDEIASPSRTVNHDVVSQSTASDIRGTSESTSRDTTSDSNSRTVSFDFSKLQSKITPDGKHIFVWSEAKMAIYSRVTERWYDGPVVDKDIQMLCTSSTIFCLALRTATGNKLSTFQIPHGEQIRESISIDGEVLCMDLSRDSQNLVAATATEAIRIVCATSNSGEHKTLSQRHQIERPKSCSNKDKISSQVISFSPNGRRAVLASRFTPMGKIVCTIFDTSNDSRFEGRTLGLSHLFTAVTARDFGLTAVPCIHDPESSSTIFLVCCSADNGTQNLFIYDEAKGQFNQLDIFHNNDASELGESIHHAVTLSDRLAYVLLNECGHLWILQRPENSLRWLCERWRPSTRLPKFSPERPPPTQLAAVSLSQVYSCSIERGKQRFFALNRESPDKDETEEIKLTPFH